MASPFQAYTQGGIVRGTIEGDDSLEELLQVGPALRLADVTHSLLSGAREEAVRAEVDRDDLLIVAAEDEGDEESEGTIHSAWHQVALHVGPYRVDGQLATLPGFDPGRALARPGGEFVLLRGVRVALVDDPTGASDDHGWAWINRYLVERVRSSIDLLNFFPGAEPEPVTAAAVESPAPSPQAA